MDDQTHAIDSVNRTIVCFSQTIYRTNGVWEGPNPLSPIVPIFVFQLPLCIFATRVAQLLLKGLHMPSFIGELIGGILIGPTFFGKIMPSYYRWYFPAYAFIVIEPMAHFALIYYAFIMGLRMDILTIRRTATRAVGIAVSGSIIPFLLGMGFFFMISTSQKMSGCVFWGFTLCVSGYSALAQIIEKQQLMHSDIGKLALATSHVSEIISWGLLTMGLAIANTQAGFFLSTFFSGLYVLFCFYAIRPALAWIIRHTATGQGYSEFYLCSILSGMAFSGVVTDAIGTHPMIGAFLFGLIIPDEVLQSTLVERAEDFILGILMPVFYTVCGIRTDLSSLATNNVSLIMVAIVIILLTVTKIISALFASFFTNLTAKEAAAIGVLTNTKSILALVILEIAQEHGALSTQEFSIIVVAIIVMTMIVPPLTMVYHPVDNVVPYKRRTIEKSKADEELRVLACIYDMRNVPSIINLLEASYASQKSPINVFALHLVELIGRATAMITVHTTRKAGVRHLTQAEAQTEQIISAFDNYELRCNGVMVQTITARSAFTSMDEDICGVAKSRRTAVIILPFHRQQAHDGEMEDINPSIRNVNENVLTSSPCSVGILIDRRMPDSFEFPRRVAVLFFGGPDDREALAYAWRMSEHESVSLKVVKLVPAKTEAPSDPMDFMGAGPATVSVPIDAEKEKMLDDECINKFNIDTVNDNSVVFQELVLNDEEETIRTIKAMDGNHDLFIVGRGRGSLSPLTAGLADWCDCPELGPIGDLFATSEFSSSFSVLVIQQYMKTAETAEESELSAESFSRQDSEQLPWRASSAATEDVFGSFDSKDNKFSHES